MLIMSHSNKDQGPPSRSMLPEAITADLEKQPNVEAASPMGHAMATVLKGGSDTSDSKVNIVAVFLLLKAAQGISSA